MRSACVLGECGEPAVQAEGERLAASPAGVPGHAGPAQATEEERCAVGSCV